MPPTAHQNLNRKAHFSCEKRAFILVRLAGIEPTTPWFVAKYSIQLSYSREATDFTQLLGGFQTTSKFFSTHSTEMVHWGWVGWRLRVSFVPTEKAPWPQPPPRRQHPNSTDGAPNGPSRFKSSPPGCGGCKQTRPCNQPTSGSYEATGSRFWVCQDG